MLGGSPDGKELPQIIDPRLDPDAASGGAAGHAAGNATLQRAAIGRALRAGAGASRLPVAEEVQRKPHDQNDQADLQQQTEERGDAAHAAHQAVADQHAEQARA